MKNHPNKFFRGSPKACCPFGGVQKAIWPRIQFGIEEDGRRLSVLFKTVNYASLLDTYAIALSQVLHPYDKYILSDTGNLIHELNGRGETT